MFNEATVWVDGLDRIHTARHQLLPGSVRNALFPRRVGQSTNQTFPWVVSDFGLTEAIESGLVKIPQLAVRDSTGRTYPVISIYGGTFLKS